MNAVKIPRYISVEEYLANEHNSPVKHEYVAGVVYGMAGGKNKHHRIATNVTISFGLHLRGKRCQAFNSDVKVRIRSRQYECYYYPDVSVVCESNPPDDTFQDKPIIVVEVASPSTRRIDAGEKKDAYLTLASLAVYMIVEQDMPVVILYRRTPQGFVQEVYEGLETSIPLPEIESELPLAEIYEGVEFQPIPEID